MSKENTWDLIISPTKSLFIIDPKTLWRYRDLLMLFVHRDFVSVYKQTVLGPLWFFIQPILTTLTFTVIFGNIAKIPTNGIPSLLFYMSGITIWNYFADCINKTSGTFVQNKGLFGKVYFPRIIVPIANVINNLLKFGIQFLLLALFWCYYYFALDSNIELNWTILSLPFLVLVMAFLGLGIGMLISSLTTKYRDFTFLIGFGVQLLMYGSPIVYPLSVVPEKYKVFIMLNPMSSIIDFFKFSILGVGSIDLFWLAYSTMFSIVTLLFGMLVFNKVEKSFIDTV